MQKTAYLSLGSNIGDRADNLVRALSELWKEEVKVIKKSAIYETEPVGKTDQAWFLNMCVKVRTYLPPAQLLQVCLSVEKLLGRVRLEKWAPRIIDIDILFYENEILALPELSLPHAELYKRRFVLAPLNEIAPDFIDPLSGKSVADLLRECSDSSIVRSQGESNF